MAQFRHRIFAVSSETAEAAVFEFDSNTVFCVSD